MLPKPEATRALQRFFKKNRVAQLSDIFSVLHTTSTMSAFRRLREVNYLSSYSHRGRYYTLPSIAHFDAQGLWRYEDIGFSRLGNLKVTLVALIEQSIAGKTHDELERQLRIRVHNSLLELVREGKIGREPFAGVFVYLSMETDRAHQQLACRHERRADRVQDLLPEAMVIEVLTEIIRANAMTIDKPTILSRLAARGIDISAAQLNEMCTRLGLKKTPGFQ